MSHFLKHQLSVTLVLDISLGQALALTESAAEFVTRCVCTRGEGESVWGAWTWCNRGGGGNGSAVLGGRRQGSIKGIRSDQGRER